MNKFSANELVDLIALLERLTTVLETGDPGTHNAVLYEKSLTLIRRALTYARTQDFHYCADTLAASESHLRICTTTANNATLAADVRVTRDALLIAVADVQFLRVAIQRSSYLDHPALFGPAVYEVFESARPDIREAGNCLAADCNTAAVFHLMRAVEWGLRALCVQFGFRKFRTRNKKTGKVTYRLIEYSEWETVLDQLQNRIDAKLAKMRRNPAKQALQEFYYPALQDIRGTRDAWRNHCMHTRREYTSEEADAILDRVRRLMVSLASHVSEV